jgi:hypothetical protein
VAKTNRRQRAAQAVLSVDLQEGLNGEGGIRTRDTTIFSRVLYQLSYLAWSAHAAALREG